MAPDEARPRGTRPGSGVTSHDVARVAGVSQSTVSRALRDDPRVTPSARSRVLAAAAQLHYVPNATARNLVTRSTRTVGMLVTELANPYYPNLIAPLHDELTRLGYRMVLFTERMEDEQDTAPLAALIDRGIDGAVLTTSTLDSNIPRELARRALPFVYLTRETQGVPADAAVVDNALGASLVAAEVVRLGHTRIGAIFGPSNTSTGLHRERGFRAGLAAAGIELPEEAVRRGPYVVETGFDATRELMALEQQPTVVVCFNDLFAIGAINAACALALKVPDDFSVIGWDDLPLAAWDVFQLTTVRQSMHDMARAAARLLVERIEGRSDAEPRRILFEPEIVRRATLGPPQSGR